MYSNAVISELDIPFNSIDILDKCKIMKVIGNYYLFKYYLLHYYRIQPVTNNVMMTDFSEIDSLTVENDVIETSNESVVVSQ